MLPVVEFALAQAATSKGVLVRVVDPSVKTCCAAVPGSDQMLVTTSSIAAQQMQSQRYGIHFSLVNPTRNARQFTNNCCCLLKQCDAVVLKPDVWPRKGCKLKGFGNVEVC